jgi:transcriptional regulator with GAF, ATPase, and Fis domain
MARANEGPNEKLRRASTLARRVQGAATDRDAQADVVDTIRAALDANDVVFYERDAAGNLKVTAHSGSPKPSKKLFAACRDDALEALKRWNDRQEEAVEAGEALRNAGTDEGQPLSIVSKVLGVQNRIVGVLVMAKEGSGAFSPDQRELFTSLAHGVAAALVARHVEPRALSNVRSGKGQGVSTPGPVSPERMKEIVELARDGYVGAGKVHTQVLERVALFGGDPDCSVLIRGESGTGKELIAKLIHQASPRASGPFVAVNVAAFGSGTLESELFGHVKGAFTGAMADALGAFRSAAGGTIFLDEISEVPLEAQGKLLRVVQEKAVPVVGQPLAVTVDFRIICATNKDLVELVRKGKFKEDLYYRLFSPDIELPPLRKNMASIELLVDHFMKKFARGGPVPTIPDETWEKIEGHRWGGNVRELEKTLQTAFIIGRSRGTIQPGHIEFRGGFIPTDEKDTFSEDEMNRAIEANDGHVTRAALDLGISRFALRRRLTDKKFRGS